LNIIIPENAKIAYTLSISPQNKYPCPSSCPEEACLSTGFNKESLCECKIDKIDDDCSLVATHLDLKE
jgi:hypothetical protein